MKTREPLHPAAARQPVSPSRTPSDTAATGPATPGPARQRLDGTSADAGAIEYASWLQWLRHVDA